jgi:hypothetical protein
MDYIWGYTIMDDMTARERQRDHKQFYIGKTPDTFYPIVRYPPAALCYSSKGRQGPIAVPAHKLEKVLGVQNSVNGELRQNATTQDLIFSIPYLLKTMSEGQTLMPGDVLATGTVSRANSESSNNEKILNMVALTRRSWYWPQPTRLFQIWRRSHCVNLWTWELDQPNCTSERSQFNDGTLPNHELTTLVQRTTRDRICRQKASPCQAIRENRRSSRCVHPRPWRDDGLMDSLAHHVEAQIIRLLAVQP